MASRIASFVGTVQLRLKIEQATSSDDDPTPMYLLDETVQVMGSNAKNIADAVEIIQQRLQHRTPIIKQKTLRLIKHSAQKGSADLRRTLARHSSTIRDLTHFKCAPDAFKGDIPWKRVQEAAREALEALHAAPSTAANQQSSQASKSLGSKIQGFGSESQGRSGMIGFGNDSFSSSGGGAGGARASSMTGFAGGLSADNGAAVLGSLSSGVRDLKDRAVGALTRPQHNRLASADSNSGSEWLTGGSGIQPQRVVLSPNDGALPQDRLNSNTAPSAAGVAMSRESKLVNRICTPSGLRVAPTSEDLRAFVDASVQLDSLSLATALQAKMEQGSWQETLRSLCALEALLEQSTTSPVAGEVAVLFQGPALACVRRARQSTQATVSQRAERVLRLLGADTLPVSGGGASSSSNTTNNTNAAAALSAGDLLGDALGAPAAPSSSSSVSKTVNANPLDLMSELSQPPVVSSSAAFDPFFAPPAMASATTATGAAVADDLFGDWMVPSATTAPPKATTTIASSAKVDLLGGLADLSLEGSRGGGSSCDVAAFVGNATASMGFAPPAAPASGVGVGGSMGALPVDLFSFPMQQQQTQVPQQSGGAGSAMAGQISTGGSGDSDVLSALHAATSGINSTKRDDAAFESLVAGALAGLKK